MAIERDGLVYPMEDYEQFQRIRNAGYRNVCFITIGEDLILSTASLNPSLLPFDTYRLAKNRLHF